MPATKKTSEYIRTVLAAVRSGELPPKEATAQLRAAKDREELRLKITRQRFGVDSSERRSLLNHENWHRANIDALQDAEQNLEQGLAPKPE